MGYLRVYHLAVAVSLLLCAGAPVKGDAETILAGKSAVAPLDNGTTTVNTPPVAHGNFRKADLVDLTRLDKSLALDIRYATPNNFTGQAVYPEARAFLQRPAAQALVRANQRFHRMGYGLIVQDAYRPWSVTKKFWDITPAGKKEFVADPAIGSSHNRGCAVDVTLCDMATSRPLPMPSEYDEFTSRSYPTYEGGTQESRRNREVLRAVMECEGFSVYPTEWWHFDYRDGSHYAVQNLSFHDLDTVKK